MKTKRAKDEVNSVPAVYAEPPNPLNMIATAIEKGIDADQLSKLIDLQERFMKARAQEAYSVAMNLCQQEMPAVAMDAENTHTKSRYALASTVNATVRPVYSKHGFSLTFYQAECPTPGFIRCAVDVMHAAGHKETKWMDLPIDGQGAKGGATSMNAVQGVGSTHSYAQRYLTCKIFNIAIKGEDDDGNGHMPIGPGEIEIVNSLISAVLKVDPKWELPRFLKWLGVQSIEEMNFTQFGRAVSDLNDRRKGRHENS